MVKKTHRRKFLSLAGVARACVSAARKDTLEIFSGKWFFPMNNKKRLRVWLCYLEKSWEKSWWIAKNCSQNIKFSTRNPLKRKTKSFPIVVHWVLKKTVCQFVIHFRQFLPRRVWKYVCEKVGNCLKVIEMEKVKRFLKVQNSDAIENVPQPRQQVQVHPQVGRRRRKSRAKRDGWVGTDDAHFHTMNHIFLVLPSLVDVIPEPVVIRREARVVWRVPDR